MRENVHYLAGITGGGDRWWEWISKETGAVRTFTGSRTDFVRYFGDDVTVLPADYVHA